MSGCMHFNLWHINTHVPFVFWACSHYLFHLIHTLRGTLALRRCRPAAERPFWLCRGNQWPILSLAVLCLRANQPPRPHYRGEQSTPSNWTGKQERPELQTPKDCRKTELREIRPVERAAAYKCLRSLGSFPVVVSPGFRSPSNCVQLCISGTQQDGAEVYLLFKLRFAIRFHRRLQGTVRSKAVGLIQCKVSLSAGRFCSFLMSLSPHWLMGA